MRYLSIPRIVNKIRSIYSLLGKNSNPYNPPCIYGKHTYIQDLSIYYWGEAASLRVGSFCSFAKGVKIYLGGNHRVDWVTTYPFGSHVWKTETKIVGYPATKGDVVIGNDVWVGADAVILSGISIGDGVVIGARAVVSKNIPPYAIAVGNPARIVRYRFSEDVIEELLRIQWWNLDDDLIETLVPYLCSPNINEFLRQAHAILDQ